ncbi:glutamic acid-rich protein-like [Camponotus floridanus]|uniref:glutamic acid-rich protein-like n=1 Tax=Camponotus floridanus TaxID=104421 RepID=UPI000DC6BE19|nr:glutamic acid-rich protein-like [Camponotus floridanus]
MRKIWREFWSRHQSVWEHIEFNDEGFWTDLEDVARQVRAARWTTDGAVVREWPSTQSTSAQTAPGQGIARGTQTNLPESAKGSTPRGRTWSLERPAKPEPSWQPPEPSAGHLPQRQPCTPNQKQKTVTEPKKSPKRINLVGLVQNGNSTMGNIVQILKKMYKQKEKPKIKQTNTGSLTEIKTEETKLPLTKLNEESVEHVEHETIKFKQDEDDQNDSNIMKTKDNDKDESDEDQSDTETEESTHDANEQLDDESEDEKDDDAEDDEEDEDDEDEEANTSKVKKEDEKEPKTQAKQFLEHHKKNRCSFCGQFTNRLTADELKQHFLTKVDTVSNVRISIKSDIKTP